MHGLHSYGLQYEPLFSTYIGMAYIGMAYRGMAYIVMAYIV